MALDGIFTSKLIYGITVWGGIWGLPGSLDETNRKSTSITKEYMRKLQVLQNSALRTQTGSRYDVPTATLLSKTGQLSVHQLAAYHSATQVYKIHQSKQPSYHHNRLFGQVDSNTRTAANLEARVDFTLSLAHSSFFYQAPKI